MGDDESKGAGRDALSSTAASSAKIDPKAISALLTMVKAKMKKNLASINKHSLLKLICILSVYGCCYYIPWPQPRTDDGALPDASGAGANAATSLPGGHGVSSGGTGFLAILKSCVPQMVDTVCSSSMRRCVIYLECSQP